MTDPFFSVYHSTFQNGLGFHAVRQNGTQMSVIYVVVATGSIDEGEHTGCGLSHFLEHMLFEGTEGDQESIADQVSAWGGYVNAFTSFHQTVYYFEVPARHTYEAMRLLGSMIQKPLFREEAFITEKDIILRERDMCVDRPGTLLFEKFCSTVFHTHPLRHPIIGYREKILEVNREMMVNYYRNRYTASNCDLVIVSPESPLKLETVAEKVFGNMPRGVLAPVIHPQEPQQLVQRHSQLTFAEPLARIQIGGIMPGGLSTDLTAFDLLLGILGQNTSSRLVRDLELERQLAVKIVTTGITIAETGLSAIHALTSPDKAEKVIEEVLKHLHRIAEEPVSDQELRREKNQQKAALLRELKTNSAIAQYIASELGCNRDVLMPSQELQRIESVTAEDIRRVAAAYYQECKLSIVTQYPETSRRKYKSNAVSAVPEKPEMLTTSHGLRVRLLPDNRLPLMDASIILPGGSLFETPVNAGISTLLGEMLFCGTRRYSENELNDLIDENAIECSCTAGNQSILLNFNAMSESLDALAEIMKTVLGETEFGKEALVREKHTQIESIRTRALDPRTQAFAAAMALLYGNHPFALPRIGTEQSVSRITAAQLLKFYRSLWNRDRVLLGFSGNFDRNAVLAFAEELDAILPWNSQTLSLPTPPFFPDKQLEQQIELPREQSYVCCSLPGCDNFDPDRFILDVLNNALNGMSSRLFKTIRGDRALAYATGAQMTRGFHRGAITLYAGTKQGAGEEVLQLIRAELRRMAEEGLTIPELESAKKRLIADIEDNCSRSEQTLLRWMLSEYYGDTPMSAAEEIETYRAIDKTAVHRVSRRFFANPATVGIITASPQKEPDK